MVVEVHAGKRLKCSRSLIRLMFDEVIAAIVRSQEQTAAASKAGGWRGGKAGRRTDRSDWYSRLLGTDQIRSTFLAGGERLWRHPTMML